MNPRTKQGREELRVLCENATPGAWTVGEEGPDGYCIMVPGRIHVACYCFNDESGTPSEANAIFIARARTALPEALDALEAAEAVIEAARQWSECVELGFAAEMRPDIARAMLNRALAAYDAKKGGR